MINYLEQLDLSAVKRAPACSPDEVDTIELENEVLKSYGRSSIVCAEPSLPVFQQISPSTIASVSPELVANYLKQFTQEMHMDIACKVDLIEPRKKYSAKEVGEWVHVIYEALLKDKSFKERVFTKVNKLSEFSDICDALFKQVDGFKDAINSQFGQSTFSCELPMMSEADNGSIVSGMIDLLIETEAGFLIVDHKTDQDYSKKMFDHHCLQLAAYASFLKLNKPIIGLGINWIQKGKVQFLMRLNS